VRALFALPGFLLLAGAGLGVIASNITMQSEVNSQLEPDKRYSYLFQWPGKGLVIMALHRQFFPESPLRKVFWWSVLSVVVSIALLGSTGQI
jgi:hypothetical protein